MYQIEIKHDGLNKYRVIKGTDKYVVEQKARVQLRDWDTMWEKKLALQAEKSTRERAASEKEQKRELAIQLTNDALEQLSTIENTLKYTLSIDDKINWEDLNDKSKFNKEKPKAPKSIAIPSEPKDTDEIYRPKLGLLDKVLSSKKNKKVEEVKKLFIQDHEKWLVGKEEPSGEK